MPKNTHKKYFVIQSGSVLFFTQINWAITDETTQDAYPNANSPVPEIRAPTGTTFKITDTKLQVPVATLSTEDHNRLLEQLKKGFKKPLNGINANQK